MSSCCLGAALLSLFLKEIASLDHSLSPQQNAPLQAGLFGKFPCYSVCSARVGVRILKLKVIRFRAQNLYRWCRHMHEHKFKIGKRLFPARSVDFSVPDVAYVVAKRLPMRAGEFEYQIKSLTKTDERVVRESQLRPKPLGNRPDRPSG